MNRSVFANTRGLINPIGEVALALTFRDRNMNLTGLPSLIPNSENSLVNAMPWWNVSKKSRYFSDVFFPSTRIFLSISSAIWSDGDSFRKQENDLETIFSELRTLSLPKFP